MSGGRIRLTLMKHNQYGGISGLAISFILTVIVLVAALVFGVWAYQGRQDYKNNVDAKIATAVEIAKNQQAKELNIQFAHEEELPLTTYSGPQAYGSIVLNYPKTWSGYVDSSGQGDALVDGYFDPGVVPSISDQSSIFALRLQVLNESYPQILQQISSQSQQGQATITAYALPKLPKVVGVMVNGLLSNQQQGTMVVLPLRANTLELWTEGTQYLNDFNKNILPNFSFSP